MKTIVFLILFTFMATTSQKIDFGKGKDGRSWLVVNDGVMGGLSEGNAQLTDNSILFQGNVSLDNNGGFSSLRSQFSNKKLEQYKEVKIRYRSSGISLAMTLSVSRRWYVPNYKTSLAGTEGEWKTVTLPLKDFRKHYIGRPMNETLNKDAQESVMRFGFITDEKKYGSFEFEIDYILFE
jgi:monofunctional biosynthetic peptidoglycan transglycosylase